MSDKDVGNMGESLFSAFCSTTGMVANKSDIDRHGWDFHVEFVDEKTLPFDPVVGEPTIEMKVQVKTSDRTTGGRQIKLTNLLKMCNSPSPCFICFIELGENDLPQNIYVKHIDEQFMRFVFQRAHELDQEGKEIKGHKPRIKYTQSDRLDEPTGRHLKEKFISYIPNGMSDYVNQKIQLVKSIGFEDGSRKINFRVSGSDGLQKLQNMMLGLDDRIDIENIEIKSKRFGRVSEETIASAVSGKIKLEAKPEPCTLNIRRQPTDAPLSFKGQFHNSPLNSFLQPNQQFLRFSFGFMEILLNMGESSFKVEVDPNKEPDKTIQEIGNFLLLIKMFKDGNPVLYFEIVSKDKKPFSFEFKNEIELDDYSELISLHSKIEDILRDFCRSNSETYASIQNLTRLSLDTSLLHQLLFENVDTFDFTINLSSEDGTYPDSLDNVAVTTFGRTLIGESSLYIAFIAFSGTLHKIEGQKYHFHPINREVGARLIVEPNSNEGKKVITAALNLFKEKIESTHDTVLPLVLEPFDLSVEASGSQEASTNSNIT